MLSLFRLFRYRFFLFAGILPFFLGSSIALYTHHIFDLYYFLIALFGVFFALAGVETFNEYFDSRLGTDRVFDLDKERYVPHYIFFLGVLAFVLGGIIAIYLMFKRGWPIGVFSFLGFISACFYVAPPLRLAYRGLGETAIFLSYGPLMTLGSFYVQTKEITLEPFFASLIPGFLLFALAIANEIPDYYQDRLVGKRNLVVRLGKKKAVALYHTALIFSFITSAISVIFGFASISLCWIFILLPLAITTFLKAQKTYDSAYTFIPVIRRTLILYLLAGIITIGSYISVIFYP
jgi:1,4-dihydroxy-2-naphthoate octaprenyltransferase